MTNQLKTFLFGLLHSLCDLRMQPRESRGNHHDWSKWGRISGRIGLAQELGLITLEQQYLFLRLLENASEHMGKPFPSKANAGPLIPFSELLKRNQSAPVSAKPQSRDSANEKSEPVPAPTSRPGLRLLCLLDETASSDSSKPVATMQPLPPRPRINGQWPSSCRAPLVLRDTQARFPSASVLVRCEQHRQANAVRPAARAI